MNDIVIISKFLLEKVIHILPYFLVSISLSVLIRSVKMDAVIKEVFSKKIGIAILLATLVGAFSPLCSCTVIPVIGGLLVSGVPLAPIMAFWIASPTMDPEIIALSASILGWPLAIARLLATLLLSLGAGYLTWFLGNTWFLKDAVSNPIKRKTTLKSCCKKESCCVKKPIVKVKQKLQSSKKSNNWKLEIKNNFTNIDWKQFRLEVLKESWRWGRWLLLALIMEVLIVRYVPQELIIKTLGSKNWFAIPLAALVGIPLYISEIGSLPIVSGLLSQGMLPGAAIAFLIAGPITTLPAMSAVYGIVNRRIFILYMSVGLIGSIVFGIISNFFLLN